jgi:hypothetical protein
MLRIPRLNLNHLRQKVSEFNSSGAPYYLADLALHQAFRNGLKKENLLLCIMAVNSFWNANVDKEPKSLKYICESVFSKFTMINSIIKSIREYSLPINEKYLSELIKFVHRVAPHFLKAPNGKRINYSFTTKFLHWCCPSTLPIIDNLSARAINRIVGQKIIWVPGPNKITSIDLCLRGYEEAIRFYNDVLGELTEKEKDKLVQYDLDTQPSGLKEENTVIRILDKAFWMEEKELIEEKRNEKRNK